MSTLAAPLELLKCPAGQLMQAVSEAVLYVPAGQVSISQLTPEKPFVHLQAYLSAFAVHFPPFWHGLESQPVGLSQLLPSHPVLHWHAADELAPSDAVLE